MAVVGGGGDEVWCGGERLRGGGVDRLLYGLAGGGGWMVGWLAGWLEGEGMGRVGKGSAAAGVCREGVQTTCHWG